MTEVPYVVIENIAQVKQVKDSGHLTLLFVNNQDDGGANIFVCVEPNCIRKFAKAINTAASLAEQMCQV